MPAGVHQVSFESGPPNNIHPDSYAGFESCKPCHSPHKATGSTWAPTPIQDDARCITCHEQYATSQAVAEHTHHPVDSSGSRCMNCHMPKINEGLQDVVRTHTIFSPTRADMLENNHPNACNLCHTDKTKTPGLGHS